MHTFPTAHGGHVPPPQSTSVSAPFLTPSSHAAIIPDEMDDDVVDASPPTPPIPPTSLLPPCPPLLP
ncbi:MAG TPA: hypothetical protein PK156_28865 [Polyangium sp.]|nr:hypothetical protein [Polyangium sp.]